MCGTTLFYRQPTRPVANRVITNEEPGQFGELVEND